MSDDFADSAANESAASNDGQQQQTAAASEHPIDFQDLASGQAQLQHPNSVTVRLLEARDRLLQGESEAARESLRWALRLGGNPDQVCTVGWEFQNDGHTHFAWYWFDLVVQLCPGQAEAWHSRGLAAKQMGEWDLAAADYEVSLQLDQQHVAARVNLANLLRDQGQLAVALQHYELAEKIAPQLVECQLNRGLALMSDGQVQAAMSIFKQVLVNEPDSVSALNNLGLLYLEEKQPAVAQDYFHRAWEQQPLPEVANNLAKCMRDQGNFVAAHEWYGRTAALVPEQPLLRLRQQFLWPETFTSSAEQQQCCRQLQQFVTRLDQYKVGASGDAADEVVEELAADQGWTLDQLLNCGERPPFGLQFLPDNIRPWKQSIGNFIGQRVAQLPPPQQPNGKPKIGILVSRQHEGIFLRSLSGLLKRLPNTEFDVVVFVARQAQRRVESDLATDNIQVEQVAERPDLLLQQLQQSQLSLLYYWEIGTDLLNYFLPFFRLAPRQCTSWGIQITSGIPTVDYYLSSELVEPNDAQQHYSERLLLADTLLTYQPKTESVPAQPVSNWGFSTSEHLYACLQNPGKLLPAFDQVFRRILESDPQGRIVLSGGVSDHVGHCLQQRFQSELGALAERVTILPRLDRHEYLALLQQVTVALDPFPFGGVNSTYDAIGLGTPLITIDGDFHRGRYAAGCYRKLGLPQLICHDVGQYVDSAVRVGTDPAYHREWHELLIERGHILFTDERAVHEQQRLFIELLSA